MNVGEPELQQSIRIPIRGISLHGDLTVPDNPTGLVVFAHGSGSSRLSPRNRLVARVLNDGALATLLMDLLTVHEEQLDLATAQFRFDINFLADRLREATDWLVRSSTVRLNIAYFGSSTGAAAALLTAAARVEIIKAVVSRGGRPDLAQAALSRVRAPTLLIVGGNDEPVVSMNVSAFGQLQCEKRLEIVPGATHLFEEPGALEKVAALARDWFQRYVTRPIPPAEDRAGNPKGRGV